MPCSDSVDVIGMHNKYLLKYVRYNTNINKINI